MNAMKLPIEDLSYLSVGLPDEVKMYHFSGDFAGEIAAIDRCCDVDFMNYPTHAQYLLNLRNEINRLASKA